MVPRRLFLALDVGVMDGLADRLQIVDVPEQRLVATMRALVVHHRAIWFGMLGSKHTACALARVVVALQHRQAQSLPAAGLVPSLPWRAVLDGLRPLSLIGWEGTSIGRKAGAGLEVREPRNARLRTIYSGMTAIPANKDGRGRAAPLA